MVTWRPSANMPMKDLQAVGRLLEVADGWRMTCDELVMVVTAKYDEWTVEHASFLDIEFADEAAMVAVALAAKTKLNVVKVAKANDNSQGGDASRI